jgi:hypothetical protein
LIPPSLFLVFQKKDDAHECMYVRINGAVKETAIRPLIHPLTLPTYQLEISWASSLPTKSYQMEGLKGDAKD